MQSEVPANAEMATRIEVVHTYIIIKLCSLYQLGSLDKPEGAPNYDTEAAVEDIIRAKGDYYEAQSGEYWDSQWNRVNNTNRVLVPRVHARLHSECVCGHRRTRPLPRSDSDPAGCSDSTTGIFLNTERFGLTTGIFLN